MTVPVAIMKGSSSVVVVLLVALLACAATVEAKEPPKKLQVGVKNRPEVCDRKTKVGDKLSMHYTGTLFEDGTEFDSSLPRGQPFQFTLGKGQVIKGWDQGLVGMCVGEKRRLVIPSDLGYGDRGSPPKIPANAALVFEVECLGIN